ncbi:MAG: DUF2304 domain-containing protein [Microthrixaceae bacterium]
MWQVLALLWALIAVGTVVYFVRLGRLRIKYAIPTLAVGATVGVLASVAPLARWAATGLGVGSPRALVSLVILAYASGMSLVAVRELSRLEARTRTLAEALALLDVRTAEAQDGSPASPVSPGGDDEGGSEDGPDPLV